MRFARPALALTITVTGAIALPQAQSPVVGTGSNSFTTRTIQGRVLTAQGAPMPGAIVLLKDTKTLQVRSYIAQNEGQFHFYALSSDINWELRAETNDMTSPQKTVSVFDSHKVVNINLKLKKKKKQS